MDRESTSRRIIYKIYVIDDGWNVPQEVIEEIEFRVEESWTQSIGHMKKLRDSHRGGWLTLEDARRYHCIAKPFLAFYDGQYIKTVRRLGRELITKYGVTELEAINILNGYHLKDYVDKYYRIRHLIPSGFDGQQICDRILAEHGYPVNGSAAAM